jgi:hypothetical protein
MDEHESMSYVRITQKPSSRMVGKMADCSTVNSLGEFINCVTDIRNAWGLPKHKELWFRGEAMDYGKTALRPELFRPARKNEELKPIWKLLSIENDLHDEFMRNATEHVDYANSEDWEWDSYLLMQHHEGPTRLLDWSDGALMAMHFALRDKQYDGKEDSRVYVLEPYRLNEKLDHLPDTKIGIDEWKKYVAKRPSEDLDQDLWEESYLPGSDASREELPLPRPPFVMEFPHFNRRIAAQRSRFILFGMEPTWIADELQATDSTIKMIVIPGKHRSQMRQELRDCGITESVIYPDLDGLGREMKQLWGDLRAAPEENA